MRSREPNDLTTPPELLDVVARLGLIALDPCSNPWSDVGAVVELSRDRGDDGLTADWLELVRASSCPDDDPLAFVNPPYGCAPPPPGGKRGAPLLPAWADKIAAEASRGLEVLALVPHDTSTAWWRTLKSVARARLDFASRVRFGGGHGQGKIRSVMFYAGPRRYLFAHHFEHLGDVYL